MSEIVDPVMPVLQGLQTDMADLKRDPADLKAGQAEMREKVEDLQIHLASLAGRGSQNTFDLNKRRQGFKAAGGRTDALKPQT